MQIPVSESTAKSKFALHRQSQTKIAKFSFCENYKGHSASFYTQASYLQLLYKG
jgi:hypothetical protein